jgi:hypothetical protein
MSYVPPAWGGRFFSKTCLNPCSLHNIMFHRDYITSMYYKLEEVPSYVLALHVHTYYCRILLNEKSKNDIIYIFYCFHTEEQFDAVMIMAASSYI